MEVHIQNCQNCQSNNLKNILFRESGEPDRVYVECQNCKEFVASYVIAPLGYYHHGKGYESFLRGVYRSGGFMSGSRIKKLFLKKRDGEVEAYKHVKQILKEKLEKEKREE